MAKSVPSNATPAMLEWARKTANLTIEAVADAEKLQPETIQKWEGGSGTPSLSRLRKLATRYKRPLMVFYLPAPPTEFSVVKVKDFRVLTAAGRKFSPQLCFAIRGIQERQAWAAEVLEADAANRLAFPASISTGSKTSDVARELRARLGVTVSMQSDCVSTAEAYQMWRKRIEDRGCFVFQVSGIDVEEMRGFALSHPFAPAIVVNSKDAVAARIFTLIHEICHVLLGESGITGAGKLHFSPDHNSGVERFCNRVAAETLVPTRDLLKLIPDRWKWDADNVIKRLADNFRVSRPVIVLRMFETKQIDRDYLIEKLRDVQVEPKKRSGAGGPPPVQKALSRLGDSFAQLALSTFQSGEIHGGQLSRLLDLKLKHLSELELTLQSRRLAAAV
jgi:Zn-dependent peptidase ImmA (M78 family)/transcriptional regulator with XRE-family HTH domain